MIGFRLVGAMLLSFSLLTGCGADAPPPLLEEGNVDLVSAYKLGPSDRILVNIYRHEDLSGELPIDGEGFVSLQLVGEIKAGNKTIRELEDDIAAAYVNEGYLKNPTVAVQVLNFRPFFIEGEVNQPGSHPYTNGLTVQTAASLAGGFTYRANQSSFTLQRGGSKSEEYSVGPTTRVLPGDYITVHQRWF